MFVLYKQTVRHSVSESGHISVSAIAELSGLIQ